MLPSWKTEKKTVDMKGAYQLITPWEFVFPGPYAAIRFMEGQNTDLEYWKRLGKYAMNIHS